MGTPIKFELYVLPEKPQILISWLESNVGILKSYNKNYIGSNWIMYRSIEHIDSGVAQVGWTLEFDRQIDATAFKLTWLSK